MFFYNLLLAIATIFGFPYLFYQRWRNRLEWRQRFGDSQYVRDPKRARPIWFHAASMGEVLGIRPVIQKLRDTYPSRLIFLSTMTRTGQATAKKELSKEVDHIFFVPLDFVWACKLAVQQLRPAMLIIAETEIWPNLIDQCHQINCKILVVNGRISDRSISRYRMFKWFFTPILKKVSQFLMQTEIDAERITTLGALPENVSVIGSAKSDVRPAHLDKSIARRAFGIPQNSLVIVAGSTRPGEEAILIDSFKRIREELPEAVLCLAPRHLERIEEVVSLLNENNLEFSRRTESKEKKEALQSPVFLLDTMGELRNLYSTAELAFVGGTLVPIGGHNLLEPASLGVPVLFGEDTANVREAANALLQASGGFCVKNSIELSRIAAYLLSDSNHRNLAGQQARKVVENQQGVSNKIVKIIQEYL